MGVKILPDKIVADLDPSILVNHVNYIISESPKFKNLRLPTFNATGKPNIDFAPSNRAKSLNGTERDKFKADWLAYRHGLKRVSKTTAYSNHIKNYELETRELFERETKNISLTRQTDLVTPLDNNPLTR